MANFYIYYLTNLSLILVAAKLWGRIDISWLWAASPIIAMTIVGIFAVIGQYARQRRILAQIGANAEGINWIHDFIRKAKESQESGAGRGRH